MLKVKYLRIMNLNQQLEANCIYHIYNRGINGENIFIQERNYTFFLQKYAEYLSPVVDTFAYCLLGNHFHLLIRINPQEDLNAHYLKSVSSDDSDYEKGLHSADFIVSKQFARFFSSYTQSLNRACSRTGSLFDTPFKRIEIEHNSYFTRLIWYIHFNPQKHGFVDDFRDYPHSSYQSHLLKNKTKLKREEVISWFGNEDEYQKSHIESVLDKTLEKLVIEI